MSNPVISGSALYVTTASTKGVLGTYRHSATVADGTVKNVEVLDGPHEIKDISNGIIGFFVFSNTLLLKEIACSVARKGELTDITADIVARYVKEEPTNVYEVDALLEFGTEDGLRPAREFWESH